MNQEQEKLADLLDSIKTRNQAALSELYKEVSPRLFGIQMRILKDEDIAEDALQETFIKIWKNAAVYDRQKSVPRVWLNAIARNQALDILRRARARADVNLFSVDPDTAESRLFTLGLEARMADNELLNICLDRLKDGSKRCLIGMYCDGYTQDELASLLDRPLGTVKSWIKRGLRNLRECINELS